MALTLTCAKELGRLGRATLPHYKSYLMLLIKTCAQSPQTGFVFSRSCSTIYHEPSQSVLADVYGYVSLVRVKEY